MGALSPPPGEGSILFGILLQRYISPSLLMYPVIHLCQYRVVYMYFILWVIIQYYVTYFLAQIFSALATGSSFGFALGPFDTAPFHCFFFFFAYCLSFFLSSFLLFFLSFFRISLLSGNARWSRVILYFSCPIPTIHHFRRRPGSFYWRMVFRNWDLVAGCACCY